MEDAADDIVAGRDFYDAQQIGIGQYFWDSILADIESLLTYAGIHQHHHGLPRLLCDHFPYAIYYEVLEDVAYVLAVLPVRRDPSRLQVRLMGN